ncbi:MAG: family 43 glycosylhydrolase [Chitinophagaceae bacterium]|nr:family 43 glycosylhydrolase [Chitinophagaceae bacterium]
MRLIAIIITICGIGLSALRAQNQSTGVFRINYDPSAEPTNSMAYFKPSGNLFVGDCIPFYHEDTFYLYWLIDSGHHSALNGLGGHQWVLSTSKDLKTWKQYPVVLGIDEEWEKSICTGSVIYHDKKFYAFYATRRITPSGEIAEQLSYAVSKDGIHFEKQEPNPFYTFAPGYSKRNFRDAKVSVDSSGNFHLFVSSETEPAKFYENGALVHLVSSDLKNWQVKEPVIYGVGAVPECPDYFYWNGWYYLLYSTHSETYYVMSRQPYGPWQYPANQTFKEAWSNVVKTAAFTNNRRIAAGWVPSRKDNKDDGNEIFGGHTVLREVIQQKDGTLDTKFVPEMIPATGDPLNITMQPAEGINRLNKQAYELKGLRGLVACYTKGVPKNCRITMEIEPKGSFDEYGLYLRANENAAQGYGVDFSANRKEVKLGNTSIKAVDGLNKNITLDIIMKDDIIDVCIDNRRCIVNRVIEQKGDYLWLYAKFGTTVFKSIVVAPLK